MQDFIAGSVSAREFERSFLEARRQDLARDDEIKRSWAEPYDEMLVRERFSGKLSADEFSRRWEGLWGYRPDDRWIEIFEKIFSDIESFVSDDALRNQLSADSSIAYIDENELRERIKGYFKQLAE